MKVDAIQPELEAFCVPLGVTVYDLRYQQEKLIVMLDRPAKPLDLAELAEISGSFSSFLDTREDLLAVLGNFELEVTTPGVERPLRRTEHFQKAAGKRIAIKLKRALAGRRRLWGILESTDGSEIIISDVTDSDPVNAVSRSAAKKKSTGDKTAASPPEGKADFVHAAELETAGPSVSLALYKGIVLDPEDIEEAHLYFDWREALSKAESSDKNYGDTDADSEYFSGEDLPDGPAGDMTTVTEGTLAPAHPRQTDFSRETANSDSDRRAKNG